MVSQTTVAHARRRPRQDQRGEQERARPRREELHADALRRHQGCTSLDILLGPGSGPEPCPSQFWSLETYLNL